MYFSQQLYVNYDKKIIVGKNQFFSEKKEDIFDIHTDLQSTPISKP